MTLTLLLRYCSIILSKSPEIQKQIVMVKRHTNLQKNGLKCKWILGYRFNKQPTKRILYIHDILSTKFFQKDQ